MSKCPLQLRFNPTALHPQKESQLLNSTRNQMCSSNSQQLDVTVYTPYLIKIFQNIFAKTGDEIAVTNKIAKKISSSIDQSQLAVSLKNIVVPEISQMTSFSCH